MPALGRQRESPPQSCGASLTSLPWSSHCFLPSPTQRHRIRQELLEKQRAPEPCRPAAARRPILELGTESQSALTFASGTSNDRGESVRRLHSPGDSDVDLGSDGHVERDRRSAKESNTAPLSWPAAKQQPAGARPHPRFRVDASTRNRAALHESRALLSRRLDRWLADTGRSNAVVAGAHAALACGRAPTAPASSPPGSAELPRIRSANARTFSCQPSSSGPFSPVT